MLTGDIRSPIDAIWNAFWTGGISKPPVLCATAALCVLVAGCANSELKHTREAAEQGNANAQYNLGVMYANGRGVTEDDVLAMSWFRKVAEQGEARGQVNLGIAYELGRGAPQDYEAARSWYRKAAEQGNLQAQSNLGAMYDRGQGVQDYAEAAKWYRKAAEGGHPSSQYNLGILYANGRGVSQDYVEAYKWWNLAVARGFRENQKTFADARNYVAGQMSVAQVAEAEKRAREWLDTFEERKK